MSAIRGLKQEMGQLKNMLENESIRELNIVVPSEETLIAVRKAKVTRKIDRPVLNHSDRGFSTSQRPTLRRQQPIIL